MSKVIPVDIELNKLDYDSGLAKKEAESEIAKESKPTKPKSWLDQKIDRLEKRFPISYRIFMGLFKLTAFAACFYFFIISLDLMSSAFRLISGQNASSWLSGTFISGNPVAGLVIGIVVTVLVQSSSTCTSIIVSMVGSGALTVTEAIPMIMGSNVGTSITSTIVALGQVADKEIFKRSFSGATVHDSFNLLSVLVLLPLEIIIQFAAGKGFLEFISFETVEAILGDTTKSNITEPQIFKVITKPLTDVIIKINSKAFEYVTDKNGSFFLPPVDSIVNRKCIVWPPKTTASPANFTTTTATILANLTNSTTPHIPPIPCTFMFEKAKIVDWGIGAILLVISLAILISCLIGMVKVLSSVFKGGVAKVITKIVNYEPEEAEFGFGPRFLPWFLSLLVRNLIGYGAIIIGMGMTFVVQSSSVFTSTLVPLVGLGLISIERVFPLILGSNIGTTITGILAALGSTKLKVSLQIALCHTFFNIAGIFIWYSLPFMQKVPIAMARWLGDVSSNYRWFAIVYMIAVFIILPGIILGLSAASPYALYSVGGIVILFIIIIVVINVMQKRRPQRLPHMLRNWEFVPLPLRSLKPYDDFIQVRRKKDKNVDVDLPANNQSENDNDKLFVLVH